MDRVRTVAVDAGSGGGRPVSSADLTPAESDDHLQLDSCCNSARRLGSCSQITDATGNSSGGSSGTSSGRGTSCGSGSTSGCGSSSGRGASSGADGTSGCGSSSGRGASSGADGTSGCGSSSGRGASSGADGTSGCGSSSGRGASCGSGSTSGCGSSSGRGASCSADGTSCDAAAGPAVPDASGPAQRWSRAANAAPLPFQPRPLEEVAQRRVIADFAGLPSGLQRVNRWGFAVVGSATVADFRAYYSRPPQCGDVWVCSPPKCGSMWTQELVWLLENELDYAGCSAMLTERWTFRESCFCADLSVRRRLAAARPAAGASPPPSTRFIKSHMPLSLWPPGLLDTCRVVYVARNPKDLCVSFFSHARRYRTMDFGGGLDAFVDHFMAGTVPQTPVVPHMIEAWEARHHPNLCFVFYEDLKRDLRGQIGRLAAFLGRQYLPEAVDTLARYLHIDAFKRNPWRREDFGGRAGVVNDGQGEFVRAGKTGDWKNHMSTETSQRFDRWLELQLESTDLHFTMELAQQD